MSEAFFGTRCTNAYSISPRLHFDASVEKTLDADVGIHPVNTDMMRDAGVTFIKDSAGAVTHAAFRINGNEISRAKKIG